MEITDIKLKKINSQSARRKTLAYVSVTFDNVFVVHNIALVEIENSNGEKVRKIIMPRRRTNKGEYVDIAHPIVNDFREFLTNSISEAYDKLIK